MPRGRFDRARVNKAGMRQMLVYFKPDLWIRLAAYSILEYGKVSLSLAVNEIIEYYLDNVARFPKAKVSIENGAIVFKGFEPLEPGDGRDTPKTTSTITAKAENMDKAQQKPRPSKLPKYLEDNPWLSILSKAGAGEG
jgi:hypothetical protein